MAVCSPEPRLLDGRGQPLQRHRKLELVRRRVGEVRVEILPGHRQAAEAAGGAEVRELRRPLGQRVWV